ncbi:alpha/beta hydrolase [Mameliella alba]|nr:alpha/beta hydrolase [Antarctobacter heliothermus]MBY6144439.1 alpha/beta hydrolase [Mameliella alba]
MSADQSLSASDMGRLSPSLRAQAETYAKARAARGVDDDSFDVDGARAALAKSSEGRATAEAFMRRRLGEAAVCERPGQGPVLLYLHGGGFVGGSVDSHGHIALQLAAPLGLPVCFVDYRLAPEHPFPAAFDDVDAALSATRGPVLLAGDSVGGALALFLALHHRDRARIRALALLAPMLAFDTGTSEYMRTHGRARAMIANAIRDGDRTDPRLCPLAQDLSHLPPTLVQSGGADYVKADGIAFASRAMQAGAPVVAEHWPHMPHVWQRYAPDAPEAARALARASAFLSAHAGTFPST